jgi:glutamine amidotransferase
MIAILDYGAGNLRSVENTLAEIGADYTLVQDAAGLQAADKIILPGVGHFGQMMRALDAMNVRGVLRERIDAGVPFFGICLGMHALFEGSEEAPGQPGLGLFKGSVQKFGTEARVPHMGWNTLARIGAPALLAGLGAEPYVYFAHSYYVPVTEATAATCTYMLPYTAAVEHGNVFGVQFHPEKSGPVGLQLVRNFIATC